MTNACKGKKKRLGKLFIISGLLVLAFAFYVEIQIRPLIERVGEYQSKTAAVRIINDALLAELASDDYDYENIIRITYDANGGVKSISGDMRSINRLKARAASIINNATASLEALEVGISLGTASGIAVFYGRGPVIPIRVLQKGYANVELISEFSSAGINQTKHSIYLRAEAEIIAVIPGNNKAVTVDTLFLVAETIIVGEVPDMYIEVSGGGEIFGGNFIGN